MPIRTFITFGFTPLRSCLPSQSWIHHRHCPSSGSMDLLYLIGWEGAVSHFTATHRIRPPKDSVWCDRTVLFHNPEVICQWTINTFSFLTSKKADSGFICGCFSQFDFFLLSFPNFSQSFKIGLQVGGGNKQWAWFKFCGLLGRLEIISTQIESNQHCKKNSYEEIKICRT